MEKPRYTCTIADDDQFAIDGLTKNIGHLTSMELFCFCIRLFASASPSTLPSWSM